MSISQANITNVLTIGIRIVDTEMFEVNSVAIDPSVITKNTTTSLRNDTRAIKYSLNVLERFDIFYFLKNNQMNFRGTNLWLLILTWNPLAIAKPPPIKNRTFHGNICVSFFQLSKCSNLCPFKF